MGQATRKRWACAGGPALGALHRHGLAFVHACCHGTLSMGTPLDGLPLFLLPTWQFYFSPGDTGFKVFDTRFGRIGIAICWDQWFPEAARALALQGAEVGGWFLVS